MNVFTTETDIANLALGFLNQKSISDFSEQDSSDNTLTSLQFYYPIALEQVIRDLKMELTTRFDKLVKLCDNPTKEWLHAYYLPPKALKLKRIFSGIYPDSKATRVPHRKVTESSAAPITVVNVTQANPCVVTALDLVDGQVIEFSDLHGMLDLNGVTCIVSGSDGTNFEILDLSTGEPIDSSQFQAYTGSGFLTPLAHMRILTNIQECRVEYAVIPDISLWSVDFATAVGYKLAQLAGIKILGIEHKDFVDGLGNDYKAAKKNAAANDSDESFKGVRPLSDSTLSRMSRRVRRDRC